MHIWSICFRKSTFRYLVLTENYQWFIEMEYFQYYPRYYQGFQIRLVDESRINTMWASDRKNIEHIFVLYSNVFELFNNPKRIKLLHYDKENVRLIFNSFLVLNCYNCFNGSSNSFGMNLPSIEKYLPLNESLPTASDVTEEILGEIYHHNSGL